MKVLEKISDYAGKYMAIIALLVAIIALVFPGPVSSVIKTSYVNILLGIVMFGMGMTLTLGDFKVVFTKPKAVITGIFAQFIIMPGLAFILVPIFQLPLLRFPQLHRSRRRQGRFGVGRRMVAGGAFV